MNKIYSDSGIKCKIEDKVLKLEVSLEDLAWIFKNSPDNFEEWSIKSNKLEEFGDYVAERLYDEAPNEEDNLMIGVPFQRIFDDIFEGDEAFVDYGDED